MAGLNKYQAYPEYRDSGVEWLGEIPAHWETLQHKYVAYYTKGKNPSFLLDTPTKNTLPYLSMDCLRNNSIDKYAIVSNDIRIALEGQPLIIWAGSNAGEFVKGRKGILSSTMASATLNYPLHMQYYWYLCTAIESEMRKHANGMGIPHVNGEELKNIHLSIPSITEQKSIAGFLEFETTKISNLIEKQQQLIELLKEKRQVVISHAVTKGLNPDVPMKDSGVKWLGEVPKHWHICKLKWFANLKSGDFITSNSIEPEGNYPVYGGNGLRGYYSYFTHNGEYVLIGRQGALCGNINYAIGKFWASEHAVVVTPNERAVTIWLGELLRIMNLNQYSVSAAQPGLAVERITDLYIPIPPYQEQINIGTYISKYISLDKKLIEHSTDNIELLKERRTALISAAVTGKIDLRNWTAPIPEAETPTEASA
ncbi:TPA: restriction endonuclease subunit S [Escherichia coli]|nr:restriction endonuclease subunit S [Escherichia coli]